jgi:hypothetical protein
MADSTPQAAQPASHQMPLSQAVIQHAREDMKNAPPAERIKPPVEEAKGGRKLGEGALGAMGRMGFKELAQALPAFPDSVRPIEEPGAFNNITPMEAADERGYDPGHDPLQGSAHRAQFQSHDHEHVR